MRNVSKCTYCGYEGIFEMYEPWQFKFYDVKMFYCPKYNGALNYHCDVSPRTGKVSEFIIKH